MLTELVVAVAITRIGSTSSNGIMARARSLMESDVEALFQVQARFLI